MPGFGLGSCAGQLPELRVRIWLKAGEARYLGKLATLLV
jgi:hypothetical protein